MDNFSADETRRWNAWQAANAVSARTSARHWQMASTVVLTAVLIALAAAVWTS
jgi:hypothetical protein